MTVLRFLCPLEGFLQAWITDTNNGLYGGVAERFKAVVLKTTVPKGTGGSNPSPSANI